MAAVLVVWKPDPLHAQSGTIRFTEVGLEVGARYEHAFRRGRGIVNSEYKAVSGGVAAGDYNGDGWVDLYVIRADSYENALLRNLGNGRFENVAAAAGVAIQDSTSGPSFFDFDGDGLLDLLVGGIENTQPRLFRNVDGEVFEDVTDASGLFGQFNSLGHAAGDLDNDGDLDLFMAGWGTRPEEEAEPPAHLWENLGDGSFRRILDSASGLGGFYNDFGDLTFAPNFADINNDGWLDILVTSDFGTSQVFLNEGDRTFRTATDEVITDENGMGSAIADYDRDGYLDWLVTSIWDPNQVAEGFWGVSGNRLYRNRGDGSFEDVTTQAGVRMGFWGWGACFSDFNNDGNLDIFHVNGFPGTEEYEADASRLFVANGDGTFTEQSALAGLIDDGQGRGIVCFDYDRDGDVDIFVANYEGPSRLYRNDGESSYHFLNVALRGPAPNTQGTGARVTVTSREISQMHEMRLHNNYVSHQPGELHYGLAHAEQVDELKVEWPDGSMDVYQGLEVDRFLILEPGAIADSRGVPCQEDPMTLCLRNGRFEVSATFTLPGGDPVAGRAGTGSSDQWGYLWFLEPDNPEVVVKVLDACVFSGRYWIFVGGLTNVEVELRIEDSKSEEVLTHRNTQGSPFVPIFHTRAFAACP